jgi:tetratricopeptide (TPR) repeat protein
MDELVLLDIIASNNWKRPVYFTSDQVPVGFGLENYLRLDGFAYKLTMNKNVVSTRDDIGYIDTDLLYNRYMKTLSFSSWSNPNVYLDNTHVYTINGLNLRNKFSRLAEKLIQEGKSDKAEAVLDKILTMLPANKVPFDYSVAKIAGLYFQMQKPEKGNKLFKELKDYCTANLTYYKQLKTEGKSISEYDENMNLIMLQLMAQIAEKYGMKDELSEISLLFEGYRG